MVMQAVPQHNDHVIGLPSVYVVRVFERERRRKTLTVFTKECFLEVAQFVFQT